MANTLLPIQTLSLKQIENKILTIRGVQVMLDRDIASLYGIPTGRLNEQVKRNMNRFPEHFRFQLNTIERDEVIANCENLQDLKFNPSLPYCFTEQGVAMLSAVLHTPVAVRVSIQIMEAFVEMRHTLAANDHIVRRLETIEHHQLSLAKHQEETDNKIEEVFRRLDEGQVKPQQGIFYDGQIFDAYSFVNDRIREAKKRIVLIDNYVDDSVLKMLDKREKEVSAKVYTKYFTPQLSLDFDKHNAQYAPIEVEQFDRSHDRFLCIDDTVYHIGASLKDLGKKWFAFSRMEQTTDELLSKM